jgi:putative ABC transport system ATP-binding protein
VSEDGSGAPIVRARGLRKEYGSGGGLVRAVDEIDLEVAPGEALAIMGPSGCGKSTLLHLLGGLDRPSAGELWLAGRRSTGSLSAASTSSGDMTWASFSRPST